MGAEDTEAPYAFSWNTLQGDNATHAISAAARDLEGNGTTSASVNVSVVNPTTSSIRVSATTEGADLDPDGYTLTVISTPFPLAVNQSQVLSDIPRGIQPVQLTGVADNCVVLGYALRTVDVNLQGVSSVDYRIRCYSLSAQAERIVWTHQAPGDPVKALFTMNANGTDRRLFRGGGASDPEWSLDRSRVYFTLDNLDPVGPAVVWRDVSVGEEQVAGLGRVPADPTSSPDHSIRCYVTQDDQLLVGGGVATTLLSIGLKPAWAPSTDSILFVRDGDIWIASSGAVNMRRLIPGGSSPHWSPSGTKILFWRDLGSGLGSYWIANADGTGATMVIQGSFLPDAGSSWSPNGRQFVYSSMADGQSNLWVINTDGTGATNITNGTGETNIQPTWFR
jgi:hypothetical protein